MKSRGILLFCVLAACAEGGVDTGAANGPQSLERASWAVTHAVPAEFATIADALDAADAGDIVEVAPGEYLEDLIMPAGVRLVGDPADPAIVRGTVVVEAVVDVGLGDLVIVGEGRLHRSTGLNILGSDVDVKGVRIEEHGVGVVISGSPDEDGAGAPGGALIAGCDLSNNGVGVIIDGAAGVTVVNNQLLFNDGAAVAISTEFGPNDSVLVLHNTMVANGFGGGVGAAVVATGGGWRASRNLIVSGDIGIHCVDGPCGHDYDLVFGNRVDYSGEAAPGPNDVAADPLFVNPGALDLRLQRRSPAIDAADPDGGVAFDAQGVDRPFGPAPDIGAFEFAPASSRLTLAINEVMSNPLDEAKDEYVELYNFGQNPVDAAGILLTDGDSDDVV